MELEYKILTEWAAPTFYDYKTNHVVCESGEEELQAYWVVSWDKENESFEWLERFSTISEAEKYLENIKSSR